MDGFEVDIAALRAAADRAHDGAGRADAVDLGAAVTRGIAGMPGSGAAQQAAVLAGAWRDEVAGWVKAVRGHGDGLRAAADGYAANEAASAREFTEAR